MATIKFPQLPITLVSAIALTVVSLTNYPSPVRAQSNRPVNKTSTQSNRPVNKTSSSVGVRLLAPLLKQKPLDFSGDGRPGRRAGGGSRNPCPAMQPPLTALMPVSNWGKTVAERPSFWFYVPYSSQAASSGEFVLQDEAYNDVLRTQFVLPAKIPGFVSFGLPPTAAPLEINKWYRWYFKLYCQPQQLSTPVFVQGWVQRVELKLELESQLQAVTPREYVAYLNNHIWYDALTRLAELRLTQPNNFILEQDWTNLLRLRGISLEHLNQKSIVGNTITNQNLDAD